MLENRVAVITGASRGIGRAIVLAFAKEGADIVLVARDEKRTEQVAAEVRAIGRKALVSVTDVAKEDAVERMAVEAIATFGNVDILVNNAGISKPGTPVWTTTVEQWDEVMGINLRGAFLCARAFIPSMMERGTGFIVNIGSDSGRMAGGSSGAYATSKWGLMGYTVSLAASLRQFGIRVNAINPGWVDTDMSRDRLPYDTDAWSTPEQIAQAALFLVTNAPPDLTGQAIDVFAHP